MKELTRQELCWLWVLNSEALGGADLEVQSKLEDLIEAKSKRPLNHEEIKALAYLEDE